MFRKQWYGISIHCLDHMRFHKMSSILMPYFRAQQTKFYIVGKKEDQMNFDMPARNSEAFEVIVMRCVAQI